MQPNLMRPSAIHRKRLQFERDYSDKGFEYVYLHEYPNKPLLQRCLDKVKRLIKKHIL